MHLLEALLGANSTSSLFCPSASSALNRFLNLVAQLCERRFGLIKFPECAARAGIPGWLVPLRHQCAHGETPGRLELMDALEFGIRWTVENYWRRERDEYESEEQGNLQILAYLKCFTIVSISI